MTFETYRRGVCTPFPKKRESDSVFLSVCIRSGELFDSVKGSQALSDAVTMQGWTLVRACVGLS